MKRCVSINKFGINLLLGMSIFAGYQSSSGTTFDEAKKKVTEALTDLREFDYGLSGDWTSGCTDIELFDISGIKLGSVQREVSFLPTGFFQSNETFFLKPACQDPALEYKLVGTVSNFAAKDGSETHLLDVEVKHQFLKVKNESVARTMNAVNTCGINNWDVEREEDIVDLDCSTLKAAKTFRDVYDAKSNSLRMGRASHNLTIMNPTDPDKIDPKYVFK